MKLKDKIRFPLTEILDIILQGYLFYIGYKIKRSCDCLGKGHGIRSVHSGKLIYVNLARKN